MLSKSVWLAVIFVASAACAVLFAYTLTKDGHQTNFEDSRTTYAIDDLELGFKLEVRESYSRKMPTSPKDNGQFRNFERLNPQGLLTIRHEKGLAKPANLSRQNLLDYINSQITQFFPVKYGNYMSESLRRVSVNGRETVEHSFAYSDSDGNPVKAKLLAIPYDQDSAYYFILQSHAGVFDQIKDDLRYESIELFGPKR